MESSKDHDSAEELLRVAIKSRVYHADLLAAAEKMGGLEKLASHLGLNKTTVGNWIRLKSFPSLELTKKDGGVRRNIRLARKWPGISRKLFKLTGKSVQQLFPDFVRLSGFLEARKETTKIVEVNAGLMLGSQEKQPLSIGTSEIDVSREEMAKSISDAMQSLNAREREVLMLRFGLGSEEPHTFREVGLRMRISKERVRQIERRAIHKLREDRRRPLLEPAIEMLDIHECPQCKQYFSSFQHCDRCDVVLCETCLRTHKKSCLRKQKT